MLLPTRNGGELLSDCIKSVLSQDFSDFELVVSDNCSDERSVAAIRRFDDARIVYLRHDSAVPVSDNWNAALAASRGEYFVMLGDDDGLLPGYLRTMDHVVRRYNSPDCIHYSGYAFVFPNSIESDTAAYYDPDWAVTMPFDGPVPRDYRLSLVKSFFSFRGRFQFNSQLLLVRRGFVDRLSRGFYVDPYPDFFSGGAMLLEADSFIYYPRRMVVVGISPKSAGHYYYSSKEGFNEYLGIASGRKGKYGPFLDSWLAWLEVLASRYRDVLGHVHVDWAGFARHSMTERCKAFGLGRCSLSELISEASELRSSEWVTFFLPRLAYQSLNRIRRAVSAKPSVAQVLFRGCRRFEGGSLGSFVEAVARGTVG